jgi:Icc-related predicted phosphoesterase
MTPVRIASILTAAALFGCPKAEEPAKAPAPPAKDKAPQTKAPDTDAAKLADPACAVRFTEEGEAKTLDVAGKSWEVKGARVTQLAKDDDDQIVIGVLADVKEDTPENLANLDAILKFFKESHAEAIVAAGDLGDDEKQIENVLNKLAESQLPIFAIIGNREGRAAFNSATQAAASKYPGLFSLNKYRLVMFDDAALISVPGYHNKVYIHAEDGCLYGPADLEATKPAVQAAKGKTMVLVSHGPPKQEGADALDRTLEQVNVGDPALSEFIKANGIKFGIFANIHEAGGRATVLSGQSLVSENKPADELYLNTGPADSVRWTMNDGTESVGMASVLTVKGDKASFKVFRLPKK